MSMLTSETLSGFGKLTALVVLTSLAGCSNGLLKGGVGGNTAQVQRQMSVAGGAFLVTGPKGYCVDPGASRPSARVAVVVLARCDAVGGSGAPSDPGLLSVAVSRLSGARAVFPDADTMAALARGGHSALTPPRTSVQETRTANGLFMMRANQSRADDTGVAPTYWRTVFEANGFAVSARLNAFEGRPISNANGFATLKSLAERVKTDNAVSSVETIQTVPSTETIKGGSQVPGIFSRIFRRN